MLRHKATNSKIVAALRDALPQVELISTSRDRGGNKNVAQNVCRRVLYTGQVSCNLCPNKIARPVAGKIGSCNISFTIILCINNERYLGVNID